VSAAPVESAEQIVTAVSAVSVAELTVTVL
jgi:hypothetical protein